MLSHLSNSCVVEKKTGFSFIAFIITIRTFQRWSAEYNCTFVAILSYRYKFSRCFVAIRAWHWRLGPSWISTMKSSQGALLSEPQIDLSRHFDWRLYSNWRLYSSKAAQIAFASLHVTRIQLDKELTTTLTNLLDILFGFSICNNPLFLDKFNFFNRKLGSTFYISNIKWVKIFDVVNGERDDCSSS